MPVANSIFRRKIAFVLQNPRQRSCSSFAEAAPASRSCATLIVVGGEQALQLLWRGGGEVHGCEYVPVDLPDGELKKGQLLVYYCPVVQQVEATLPHACADHGPAQYGRLDKLERSDLFVLPVAMRASARSIGVAASGSEAAAASVPALLRRSPESPVVSMQLAIPAQVAEPDEEKYRLPPPWDFATETTATDTDVAGAASVVSTTVDAATTKTGAAWGRTSALGKARTALGNSPGARTALGNSPGARTALGNSPGASALGKSHRARRRESRRQ